MRFKFIFVFLLFFTAFVAVTLWRTDQMIFGQKVSQNESQNRSLVPSLVEATESELRAITNSFNLAYSQIKQDKEFSKASVLARFHMLGLGSFNGKEWLLDHKVFQQNTPTKTWAANYASLALKTINPSSVPMNGTFIFTILDPQRKSYLLFLNHALLTSEDQSKKEDLWFVAIAGIDVFQNIFDRQKGQPGQFFMVNNKGQALAHTTPEYVGTNLSQDPLVAEIMEGTVASGSGDFEDIKGEKVQGVYEQVPATNSAIVITTPVSVLMADRDSVRLQILLMGLGMALLGVAMFLAFFKEEKPRSAAKPSKVPAPTAATSEISPVKKEEMFAKIASSISHEMRGPLTSVLAHAQILKSQVGESTHLAEIEKEARSGRELIQKLMTFAGERSESKQNTKVSDVLSRALKNIEAIAQRKGVQIKKEINDNTAIELSVDNVAKAIEAILQNAIEAMERGAQKILEISLQNRAGLIELSISDSGEGISSDKLEKVFDPFFTTKPQPHVGLGLSAAYGILKEAKAEVRISSEEKKGTRVVVTFNPNAEKVATAVTPPPPSPEQEFAAPSPPPPPPGPKATKAPPPTHIDLQERAVEEALDFPPAPDEFAAPPAPPPTAPKEVLAAPPKEDWVAKIDLPSLDLKKKEKPIENVEVVIRKPGAST